MLIEDVERYIALRRSLGFKLKKPRAIFRHSRVMPKEKGQNHIRTVTAMTWSAETSSTPGSHYRRLQEIALLARFLHAEDPAHEIRGIIFLSVAATTGTVY